MEFQPVVGFAWFAAGVILLISAVTAAIWTMWRVNTAPRNAPHATTYPTPALPVIAGRAAAIAATFILGAGLVAHSRIRTWQGQWWTLAPTEVLVRASNLEGARSALGPRLWNRADAASPRSAWQAGALSQRQWRLFADSRKRVVLDPDRPAAERSTAAIDLGALIPDEAIVDPILAELLTSEDCDAKSLGALGITMYTGHRRITNPLWLARLGDLACDAQCPDLAMQAAFILAQMRPLPREHLRYIIARIKGRPELENVWRGIARGLAQAGPISVEPEERLEFLGELQASDDPDVQTGVAIMRPLVEAERATLMYRLRANQNG